MFKVGPLAALENVIPPDTGVSQGKQFVGSVKSSWSGNLYLSVILVVSCFQLHLSKLLTSMSSGAF